MSAPRRWVVIAADAVFADTEGVFASAVTYLTRRFAVIQPVVADLPRDIPSAIAALDASAPEGWRRELARFFDEHAPVLLRPDPDLNARLRRARQTGLSLGVYSPLPRASAAALLAAVGVTRLADVVASEEDGDPPAAARRHLQAPDAVLVSSRPELDAALAGS